MPRIDKFIGKAEVEEAEAEWVITYNTKYYSHTYCSRKYNWHKNVWK